MALRTYGRRTAVTGLLGTVLVIWLVIGALAASQRHYFSSRVQENCATAATITTTILAGPLNYMGVNPKVQCHVPQPSR